MNLLDAETILELPKGYSKLDIKNNYKRLALKYHPDKYKGPDDQFIQIQKAYHYLNSNGSSKKLENIDLFKTFNDILKTFVIPPINIPIHRKTGIKIKVPITINDYFLGISKNIKVPCNCNCEKSLCINCAGCGYNILSFDVKIFKKSLDVCMDCLGDGYNKICNCYDEVKLKLEPFFDIPHKLFDISLIDDKYFFKNDILYYNFDISFKESLVGFQKTFIDPFENKHLITVNEIIKKGDGYSIKINGKLSALILIFNVNYPKKLNNKLKDILLSIDF